MKMLLEGVIRLKSITRNLVEYTYDNKCLPRESDNFKQLNLDELLTLPECKPDIEQIIKVSSAVKITHTKVITTPKGKSLEGMVLTGKKLIVEGRIEQKMQYVACEREQSVHVVAFSSPFLTYIVIPDTYNGCSEIIPTGFIEDVTAQLDSCRQIYMNNTLFVSAEFC